MFVLRSFGDKHLCNKKPNDGDFETPDIPANRPEIVKGQGYSIRSVRTTYRPVGWPGVLVGLFSITGVSIAAAQIVNALLGTLCCWLTALLGHRLTGSHAGRGGERGVGGGPADLIALTTARAPCIR